MLIVQYKIFSALRADENGVCMCMQSKLTYQTYTFFLPLLSSTLPKSELRAAITTISTSDHSKVTPSKNEEKSPTAALSVTYTSGISRNFDKNMSKGQRNGL